MSLVEETAEIQARVRETPEPEFRPRDPSRRVSPAGPLLRFMLVDVAVIVASIAAAFVTWFAFYPVSEGTWIARHFPLANLQVYYYALIPVLLLRVFLYFACGLYDFVNNNTKIDISYITLQAVGLGTIIEFIVYIYVDKYALLGSNLQISRPILMWSSVYVYLAAVAWRFYYLRRRRLWAYDSTRLLLVGAGELGYNVYREIQRYSRLGHEIVGLIDDQSPGEAAPVKVLGRLSDIRRVVRDHAIDEIIIASEDTSRTKLVDILYACEQTDVRIRVLPNLYDVLVGKVQIQQVAGVPLIEVRNGEVPSYIAMRKRAFDLFFASIFLIPYVLSFPIIATLIKLADGGPVFYRQERVGKGRRRFMILKYRTMVEGAENMSGPVFSSEADDRITSIGRFLRRFYIDEAPQIINVLRGDMSLVGPRPERPVFVEAFMRDDPSYRLRLTVRPGITGLAQIHGYYGSPVPNKLRYDIAYINARSTRLDLKILFLTFMVAVSGKRM